MKSYKLVIFIMLIIAILMPVTVSADSGQDDKVVLGGSYSLKSGDTLDGSLIIIGGSAVIQENARITGDILLIGGQLTVDGIVGGSVNLLGGSASLNDTSIVSGNVNVASANLNQSEKAIVQGKVIQNSKSSLIFDLPNIGKAPATENPIKGLTTDKETSKPLTAVFNAILSAILAILTGLLMPKALGRVSESLTIHPIHTFGAGLLTVLVTPLALIVMIATLILIPVALLGVVALVVAAFFGWFGLGYEIGDRIANLLHVKWHLAVSAGIGTLILSLITGLFMLIPCIGWILPFLGSMVSIGAVVLTRFGTRYYGQAPV